jgi:hypothetical protein
MYGIDDALIGGVIAGGLSYIGGQERNEAQQNIAQQANAFSAQQFASRYQTTVTDMQKAGLNPMLAYSQGGGSPPSGQQANMQDPITPAVQSYQAQRMNSAQTANVEADTENKKAQADLIAGQAAQAWSSASQATANTSLIQENTKKIIEETKNVPIEGQRLKYMIQLLAEQAALAAQQGETQVQQRAQIAATVKKLKSETTLLDLDIDAAKELDNIGRTSRQLQPIIEMIKPFLRFSK